MSSPDRLSHSPPAPEPALSATFCCGLRHSGRDAAWLSLSGHLDLAAAGGLAARLEDALGGARLIVVDLRELTFVDRAGFSAILSAHQRARRSGRRLVLVRGPAHVNRLLELPGLADQVEIIDLQRIPTGGPAADRMATRAA